MTATPSRKPTSSATETTPRFGAHMSVAGGMHNAFASGLAVGCDCMQVFVKNQRQWRAAPLGEDEITRFRNATKETGIAPVVAHATYLLNLASPDSALRKRSVAALADELQRCDALGIDALILHPGSYITGKMSSGIDRIARSLNQLHRACQGLATKVLLETTAGAGTSIGFRFDQLSAIMRKVAQPERLGVCLDTCHLFAAGYDFRTKDGYENMIQELDRAIGVARVHCIHVNDSKRELASRVDRHEHIGKGYLGRQAFAHLVNDPRLFGLPMILETPKGKDGRGSDLDKVNLKRLRSLICR